MKDVRDRTDWIEEVIAIHFDPRWGTPYWLGERERLGFDPRREIRSPDDLSRLGPMPIEVLATQSIEQMIPRRFHGQLHDFVTAETGGTTGPPKRTAYSKSDFEAAFVEPFVRAAEFCGFPIDHHWLFIGPSGPHVIGKAARECARAMGSIDPFTVDFDPRWVRRLPVDSMARQRYVEHVLQQSETILETQEIGVLFGTPPVLQALATRLNATQREAIRGIHVGGMAADAEFWPKLRNEWYSKAVVMSGYGNSLAGMCPQLQFRDDAPPEYFSYGPRLALQVLAENGEPRGRVRFHRLDPSCLLPNVDERDEASPATVPLDSRLDSGWGMGVRDPRPPPHREAILGRGLY